MKKRTTEEMREYQRKRRARLRGVTPEEQGAPRQPSLREADGVTPDKTPQVDKQVDTVDMSTTRIDEIEPF